jgi:O-antigen ligase
VRRLFFFLALVFFGTNLAARTLALQAAGGAWMVFVAAVAVAVAVSVARPTLLPPALALFGGSFFLYGFHPYGLQSQAFELLVTALALVLLLREARAPRPAPKAARAWLGRLWLLYGVLASSSLLLLPPTVLSHRVFLEGGDLFRAILGSFPKDPLYPIAGVNRLGLFVLFAVLMSRHSEARHLYRMLFRGIAWAAVFAVILGLLDFVGLLSLARYNLSHLFYGGQYRRLQSTFGNPSWYACFVSCALPLVLLEFWEARRPYRLVLAAFFPLCALSLLLAAARAAWLACAFALIVLAVLATLARRGPAPLPPLGRPAWLSLGATVAVIALAALTAYGPLAAGKRSGASTGAPRRLEGLAREMRIRGLGVRSPRAVAIVYALELARQSPFFGLGYETFNLHLRSQLAVPSSGVAQVVNTAIKADASDTFFDDAHNTYLQIVVGTGALGLALWLAVGAVGLLLVGLELKREGTPLAACVFLAMIVFHFYGLFQGMQYVVVTWFVFHLAVGYAMTVDVGPLAPRLQRPLRGVCLLSGALVLISLLHYRADQGFRDIKQRYELSAYLPDEAAEFEGFYRPESGPGGQFRWMPRRGIINVTRAAPFRLVIACEHPDLNREPVVLSFRFDGQEAGSIVFRHPEAVERRFAFAGPGTLRLRVSRTFRPTGGGDRRELGVRVSAIRWE